MYEDYFKEISKMIKNGATNDDIIRKYSLVMLNKYRITKGMKALRK